MKADSLVVSLEKIVVVLLAYLWADLMVLKSEIMMVEKMVEKMDDHLAVK